MREMSEHALRMLIFDTTDPEFWSTRIEPTEIPAFELLTIEHLAGRGAAQHLPGRPAAEREEQDPLGRDAAIDEAQLGVDPGLVGGDEDDVERRVGVDPLAAPQHGARVADPVQLGVLDRARDRLLGDLDSPHGARVAGEREGDRPGAAVEVEHVLRARQPREVPGERVQVLRRDLDADLRRRHDARPLRVDLPTAQAVGSDGSRVERNQVIALTLGTPSPFGGIRVRAIACSIKIGAIR